MEQEGIAVGRTFAALKNYQVDGNKEMMAIGLMNIVGSSTSCYVTTGKENYTFLLDGKEAKDWLMILTWFNSTSVQELSRGQL